MSADELEQAAKARRAEEDEQVNAVADRIAGQLIPRLGRALGLDDDAIAAALEDDDGGDDDDDKRPQHTRPRSGGRGGFFGGLGIGEAS